MKQFMCMAEPVSRQKVLLSLRPVYAPFCITLDLLGTQLLRGCCQLSVQGLQISQGFGQVSLQDLQVRTLSRAWQATLVKVNVLSMQANSQQCVCWTARCGILQPWTQLSPLCPTVAPETVLQQSWSSPGPLREGACSAALKHVVGEHTLRLLSLHLSLRNCGYLRT